MATVEDTHHFLLGVLVLVGVATVPVATLAPSVAGKITLVVVLSFIVFGVAVRSRLPVTLVVLGVSIVLSVLVVRRFVLGIHSFSPDEMAFYRWSTTAADALAAGQIPESQGLLPRYWSYVYSLGLVMTLSGQSFVAVMFMNGMLFVLAVMFLLRTVRIVFDESVVAPGILLLTYPAAAFFSVSLLREGMVLASMSYVLFHVARFFDDGSVVRFLPALPAAVVVLFLRPEVFISLAAATVFTGVLGGYLKETAAIALTAGVGGGLLSLAGVPLPRRLNDLELSNLNDARVHLGTSAVKRDAAYFTASPYDGWVDLFTTLPEAVVYFLYYPFPWQAKNYLGYLTGRQPTFRIIFRTVDTAHLLVVTLLGLYALVRLAPRVSDVATDWNRDGLLFLLSYVAFSVAGYSMVVIGLTNVRRRLFVTPVVVVLVGAAVSRVVTTSGVRVTGGRSLDRIKELLHVDDDC
jgi:hypothetical protein